ncbi:MAG TPA: hypothetical protein VD929_08575 [Caulobacteraceae bacterium]|nr:hypothetical protein [Caulobacteraceae bacterium]
MRLSLFGFNLAALGVFSTAAWLILVATAPPAAEDLALGLLVAGAIACAAAMALLSRKRRPRASAAIPLIAISLLLITAAFVSPLLWPPGAG